MADNIPSLSEIANVSSDAGRSGVAPEPVIDNSHVVDQLNQNARFHAQNVYKKYTDFLQNKKELFQNIGDIQGLETLPEDKEYLRKQAADVLSDIMKNPSVITGGKGFDEVQQKMAKFKSDAMASKASALDEKANKLFLERNPDLYTDENVKAMEDAKKLPIGQRKSVMLQMPTILDEQSLFETALKNSVHDYSEPVEINGKHYIENGKILSPEALQEQMNLALKSKKDKYGHTIESAVKLNYEKLPDDQKETFQKLAEKNGTKPIEEYWKDRANLYKNAYLPKGTFDTDPKTGLVRFGKSHTDDKQYLEEQKLGLESQKLKEKTSNDQAQREIGWARIGIDKDKLNKTKKEDQDGAATVINEARSIINNGKPITVTDERTGKTHEEIRISDPTLLQTFGTIDKSGKVSHVPDAMRFNPATNQVTLLYADKNDDGTLKNKAGGYNTRKEEPLDQRTWLKTITKRSFPNKDIGGVNSLIEQVLKANNSSLYELTKKENTPTEQQETKPQVKKKEINRSDIHAKAQAAGYSDKEYEALLKKNGVNIK